MKSILEGGHEIGYHSEVVDEAAIWNEDQNDCLVRDIDLINKMLNIKIKGVASHNGMTGLNNLDFWKKHDPFEFGLLYEAYDETDRFNLFNSSFYISDSEWFRWKAYDQGTLLDDDRSSFGEHVKNHHKLIYLLIHADTYYDLHYYE